MRAQFPTDFAAWSKFVMRLWPPESFPNPPVIGWGDGLNQIMCLEHLYMEVVYSNRSYSVSNDALKISVLTQKWPLNDQEAVHDVVLRANRVWSTGCLSCVKRNSCCGWSYRERNRAGSVKNDLVGVACNAKLHTETASKANKSKNRNNRSNECNNNERSKNGRERRYRTIVVIKVNIVDFVWVNLSNPPLP